MTSQTTPSPRSEGRPASSKYFEKERFRLSPMSMFCGLPMRVIAEPTFDAQASASRNGIGSSLLRTQPSMRTGAIARQTMSFARTAERNPATAMSQKRSAFGLTSRAANLLVTTE